jgi:hypothetical protein
MAKKLNDLAKIGLGLAAAYGASKVLGQKSPMQIAQLEGTEADLNSMEGPAKQQIPSRSELNSKFNQMEGPDRTAMPVQTARYNSGISKAAGYAIPEPSMATDSDTRVAARIARLRGAKKGKMMKASTGGSVVAKGNKLARSRPTKLF